MIIILLLPWVTLVFASRKDIVVILPSLTHPTTNAARVLTMYKDA